MTNQTTRAISIRQPYPKAILRGEKEIVHPLFFYPIGRKWAAIFFALSIFCVILCAPVFSQLDRLYQEVTLLDFEKTQKSDFEVYTSARPKPIVHWQTEFPAPLKNSNRYMGVEVNHTDNHTISFHFKRPLIMTKYCKQISIWVFGTFNSGRISLLIEDTAKKQETLSFQTLKFRGWKKITAKIPKKYAQQDVYINSKTPFKILRLVYSPGSVIRLKKTQYILIDDITALVRPRYALWR